MKECIVCKQKHNEKGDFCSKSCEVKRKIDCGIITEEPFYAQVINVIAELMWDDFDDDEEMMIGLYYHNKESFKEEFKERYVHYNSIRKPENIR